jgi:hypothetical protein
MYDMELHPMFEASNFDAYDRERYGPALREALAHHGIGVGDVVAVTQDMGCWAICRTGVFRVTILGIFKKRNEIGRFIRWRSLDGYRVEPSGPHTRRIVFLGADGRKVDQIDFSAAGMNNTPAMAAAECDRIVAAIRSVTS